jgi:hypothetical protein
MLRAVLSWGDTQSLLKSHPARYCGRRFPNKARNVDFAVLRVAETEDCEYRPGFYCFDANIPEIEESLKSLTNTASPIEVTQPDMKRPVKISQMNQPAESVRVSPLFLLQPLREWLNKPWPYRAATRRK